MKNFTEFESNNIEMKKFNTFNAIYKYLPEVLKRCKKQKKIKDWCPPYSYTKDKNSAWTKEFLDNQKIDLVTGSHDWEISGTDNRNCTISLFLIKTNNDNVIAMSDSIPKSEDKYTFSPSNAKSLEIVAFSNNSFDVSEIKDIIFNDFIGTYGLNVFEFKPKILKDSSKTSSDLEFKKQNIKIYDYRKVKYNYIRFAYDIKVTVEEKITYETLQEQQWYKDIMENNPIELISTDKQLAKNNLVFGVPSVNIINGKDSSTGKKPKNKYLDYAIGLFKSGHIQKYDLYHVSAGPHDTMYYKNVGKYDSTSLVGYKEGMNIIVKKFNDIIEELNPKFVIRTTKDKHEYRGHLNAHKFNL